MPWTRWRKKSWPLWPNDGARKMEKQIMARRILLVLTLAAVAATVRGAPLTAAVYSFNGEWPANAKVTALVTADLTTNSNLVMLERAELSEELNEQAFGVSGMVSSEAAAKIGKITGAQVLISGQVIKSKDGRIVVVANIIGTETGRLFAARAEGTEPDVLDLSEGLSRKIAQIISDQATNLMAGSIESREARLERVIKSIPSAKRPRVMVSIVSWAGRKKRHSAAAENAFGSILLKAGFTVVDENSDEKPDVVVTGVDDMSEGPMRSGLYSSRAVIDLKIQARESGEIIHFDRAEGAATEATKASADQACQINAVDDLAERVLPLLAK
jgi:TolB-like protein